MIISLFYKQDTPYGGRDTIAYQKCIFCAEYKESVWEGSNELESKSRRPLQPFLAFLGRQRLRLRPGLPARPMPMPQTQDKFTKESEGGRLEQKVALPSSRLMVFPAPLSPLSTAMLQQLRDADGILQTSSVTYHLQ